MTAQRKQWQVLGWRTWQDKDAEWETNNKHVALRLTDSYCALVVFWDLAPGRSTTRRSPDFTTATLIWLLPRQVIPPTWRQQSIKCVSGAWGPAVCVLFDHHYERFLAPRRFLFVLTSQSPDNLGLESNPGTPIFHAFISDAALIYQTLFFCCISFSSPSTSLIAIYLPFICFPNT